MLTIVSAHSPQYAAPDNSIISLMVKFEEFNEELPFGATLHDPHQYGVDLYNRAIAGEFGEILSYVGKVQPEAKGVQTL
jgi:hypothetical protein